VWRLRADTQHVENGAGLFNRAVSEIVLTSKDADGNHELSATLTFHSPRGEAVQTDHAFYGDDGAPGVVAGPSFVVVNIDESFVLQR